MENTIATSNKQATKKKVGWVFDRDTTTIFVSKDSVNADNEKRFSFRIERYKDSNTFEESLKIISLLDEKENGYIITSIINLDNNIKELKRFGVVLGNTYYRDLYQTIENNYLNIPEAEVELNTMDNKFKDLLEQIRTYVMGDKNLITPDFWYVPVNMFNSLAFDCGYSSYEMKSLRSALARGKYIHTVSDRYAILARINSKPERVIAFYLKKLNEELSAKNESEEKSGTDEE